VTASDEDILREVLVAEQAAAFDPRDVKYTSTNLQKVVLASGATVIVKHLSPEGDWLMRASGGVGRAQLLWRSGVLSTLDPVVDHGAIGIVDAGDHDALVMRDLSATLFSSSVRRSGWSRGACAREDSAAHARSRRREATEPGV
jgi:hypothetical protein